MILLIDNYDSFSYNLFQLIGSINPDIKVIRNDELTIEEIEALDLSHIVLSPGPGRPSRAGICRETVMRLGKSIPVLGVCLGHQVIFESFGGTVSYAEKLMHGKMSEAVIHTESPLFKGLPVSIEVARYHSLSAARHTLPKELDIIAETREGEIMGVSHKEYPIYGLQFHPESILTPKGRIIIENFIKS